ncbi:MAG: sigma-E factor negative regulatory protein [Thiolinea sp.]
MNTSKQEFLSAWLDGETGDFEQRRLLDELTQDDELAQTLGRYATIGEVMRARPKTVMTDSRNFLAGLHAQLDEEPVYHETVTAEETVKPAAAAISRTRAANDGFFWNARALRYGMAAAVAVAAISGLILIQKNPAPEVVEELASETPQVNTLLATAAKPSTPAAQTEAAPTLAAATPPASPQTVAQNTRYIDWETRKALKQYVTLHMQHRTTNGIVPSLQAASYSK